MVGMLLAAWLRGPESVLLMLVVAKGAVLLVTRIRVIIQFC
jgi:hypothetical protein